MFSMHWIDGLRSQSLHNTCTTFLLETNEIRIIKFIDLSENACLYNFKRPSQKFVLKLQPKCIRYSPNLSPPAVDPEDVFAHLIFYLYVEHRSAVPTALNWSSDQARQHSHSPSLRPSQLLSLGLYTMYSIYDAGCDVLTIHVLFWYLVNCSPSCFFNCPAVDDFLEQRTIKLVN
jgi:hypothetical protein